MSVNNFSNLTSVASKWLNRLSPIFMLISVLWLCWSISRILWAFLAPPLAPSLPSLPHQVAQDNPVTNQSAFTIFAAPKVTRERTQVAPSNIILKGVMTAKLDSESSALIEVDRQINNYHIGHIIKGTQYTLSSVKWNEVVLSDGSSETVVKLTEPMNLDQKFNPQGGLPNSKFDISNTEAEDTEEMRSESMDMQSESMNIQSESMDIEDEEFDDEEYINDDEGNFDQAIDALGENPSGYLNQMGLMASDDGYEITDAIPDGLRDRIGLEPGDKILSVNGQTVGNDPAKDAKLLSDVRQSGKAQIQVQRGQQVITIRQQF